MFGVDIACKFPREVAFLVFQPAVDLVTEDLIHLYRCDLQWQEGHKFYPPDSSRSDCHTAFLIPDAAYWEEHREEILEIVEELQIQMGPEHPRHQLLPKPVEVKPLPDYRIFLRYDDGVEGEVDLAHLVGKGVFKAWYDEAFFRKVHVDEYGAVAWPNDIDMCSESFHDDLIAQRASA